MNYADFKRDTIRFRLQSNELDKVKIMCKCGHRVIVPIKAKKRLCSWCGHWVYRDKKLEFKETIKKMLKGENE